VESKRKQIDPQHPNIGALIRLIGRLRGEGGCPWDKKQTPRSMAVYLMEEMYELVDAIESGRFEHVCEELGDVLFHICFIARIYEEREQFDIDEIARRITDKMIRRHPHVFAGSSVDNTEDIKLQWHKIKKEEKKNDAPKSRSSSALDSVPKTMPSLLRAHEISERAAKAGFDWNDIGEVLKKVDEELSELKSAIAGNHPEKVVLEIGDVLFTLVNVARFSQIHPEIALSNATRKFEKRFRKMEKAFSEKGKDIQSIPHDEKIQFWQAAKKNIP
jgi:tetrapyrrole methylase family protein/MazG family protein